MSAPDQHLERDTAVLGWMGAFFFLFGLLLFAALFWDDGARRWVTTGAALVLLAIGTGMICATRALRKRKP